jgi:ATP adenylyltransferase/5',5'''-P-1,P-4-tetraphosphate phosphorylase II
MPMMTQQPTRLSETCEVLTMFLMLQVKGSNEMPNTYDLELVRYWMLQVERSNDLEIISKANRYT